MILIILFFLLRIHIFIFDIDTIIILFSTPNLFLWIDINIERFFLFINEIWLIDRHRIMRFQYLFACWIHSKCIVIFEYLIFQIFTIAFIAEFWVLIWLWKIILWIVILSFTHSDKHLSWWNQFAFFTYPNLTVLLILKFFRIYKTFKKLGFFVHCFYWRIMMHKRWLKKIINFLLFHLHLSIKCFRQSFSPKHYK